MNNSKNLKIIHLYLNNFNNNLNVDAQEVDEEIDNDFYDN